MEIDALFDHLHTLPSIPKVAQELIQQFDDPDSSIEDVARNLALDPVLSAKVLRLANSVRFRGVRPSTSIEGAAIRLGFDALRTLVLASAVTAAFRHNPSFDPRDFWQHSFDVASICRVLARQAGADPETAFTCGMLHSIGELLIRTAAPDIAVRIDAEQRAPVPADQAIGFGYPEVGSMPSPTSCTPRMHRRIPPRRAWLPRPAWCPLSCVAMAASTTRPRRPWPTLCWKA